MRVQRAQRLGGPGKGQTMKPVVEYTEAGTRKLFHKFYSHEETIRRAVEETIQKQLDTNFSKTKLASRIPYEGRKLYECRVNVGKLPAFRVAFAVHDCHVQVVFMTNRIQKSDFSRLLDTFLKAGPR